jgi:hypothetical protein
MSWLKSLALYSASLLALLCLTAGDAVAQSCSTDYPFTQNCPLPAPGLNAALAARAQHASSNAVLLNTSTLNATNGLWRDDYGVGFGASPLFYQPSNSACSLNAGNGDGGYQVKSADNKCWLAVFPAGPYDARWWGVTYPFQMYAATGAIDTNNYCFDPAHPCSLQHAADVAAQMDFSPARGTNPNQINIPGTYNGPGAIFSGTYYGTAGHGISGQYLYVVGNGSANTHVTNATGQIFSFDVSTGAGVVFQALNVQVGASQYGIFAQNPGSYAGITNDVVVSSTVPGALAGLYAEAGALLERPANAAVTISGQFNCPIQANTGGYVEFDPGGSAVFSTGTGLTAVTAFICASAASKVQWYAASVTGAGVAGDVLNVNGNSVVMQQAGTAQIPGNGITRLEGPGSFITSVGLPVLTPTLGTCANGALAGTNNNYSMQISFTGANTSCAIVFGKLAGTTAGFAGFPRCFASVNTGGATNYIQPATVSNTGITLLPNSALANGQAVYVTCAPQSGG